MKNTILFFVFACCSLFFAQRGDAQCYVRLDDASGFNTDAYQDTLQAAAAKLCAIFDSTGFPGQFKVYDFGFYLHQESTTGGYPEPFAQKIAEVKALSPYYLLFGKQTDKSGIYTKFWVDLVLPDTGKFACLDIIDPAFKDEFYHKAKISTNLLYEDLNRSTEKYYLAETATIDTIYNILKSVFECCDYPLMGGNNCQICLFTSNEIKRYYEEKGFLSLEVGLAPVSMRRDTLENILESKLSNNILLHDYANEVIGVFNSQYNIGQAAYQDFLNYPSENINIKVLVNNNASFCSHFSEINSDLANNNNELFLCMHIWKEKINSATGLLFYKFKDMTSGHFIIPQAFIYHDNLELDDLLDFGSIKTNVEQIYKNNSIELSVYLGDSNPLNKEDCWMHVINETPAGLYFLPGNSTFENGAETEKLRTFTNYQSCMELNLNKLQNSYRISYVIAHELLHQLLKKAYTNVFTGFLTLKSPIFIDPYTLSQEENAHFDCWLNLNMSGIYAQKYWPSQAGEYPEAEVILDSHKMLLRENQRLLDWKTALGISSPTFRLIAQEFSIRLIGADGYGPGYALYLFDKCSEPNSVFNDCKCGF